MNFSSRLPHEIHPNELSRILEAKRREGAAVFDLTESNPTRAGIVYPEGFLAALSDPRAAVYEPEPFGLPAARELIAHEYQATSADRVVMTASTSEAYSWLFKLLCNPGDEVLTPRPSYPLFEYLAALESVVVRNYGLFYDHGAWCIDFHTIRRALNEKTRAIVIVNPNNPTGNFIARHELRELSELCANRGIAIISDEVFRDYAIAPRDDSARTAGGGDASVTSAREVGSDASVTNPRGVGGDASVASTRVVGGNASVTGTRAVGGDASVASTRVVGGNASVTGARVVGGGDASVAGALTAGGDSLALTFTLHGLSKAVGLPQMKLAWMIADGPDPLVREAMGRLEMIADTYLSAGTPVQCALPSLLALRGPVQDQILNRLRGNLDVLRASGLRSLAVEAGWYAIVTHHHGDEFAERLLAERDVLVQPGYFYDFEGSGYLVLSLLTRPEAFQAGVSAIAGMI